MALKAIPQQDVKKMFPAVADSNVGLSA